MACNYHTHTKAIPVIRLHIGRHDIGTAPEPDRDGSCRTTETGCSVQGPANMARAISAAPHPGASDINLFNIRIQKMTSRDLQDIREAMLLSHRQRQALKHELDAIRRKRTRSALWLNLSYLLLYGFVNRAIPRRIKADIEMQKQAAEQIDIQIAQSAVPLHVQFDTDTGRQYDRVIQAFKSLMNAHKIWDVTSTHYQDRVAARSSASTLVAKREVRFSLRGLPEITSDLEVPHFQNANGADIYMYPGFIVMYHAPGDFTLIGIDELVFNYSAIRFTETGPVPSDSTIIDRTWAKVNKNGTPDRRFKSNYQIPIVRYGELRLKTAAGLHEEYECSNYEATEAFGLAFGAYQRYIRMIREERETPAT